MLQDLRGNDFGSFCAREGVFIFLALPLHIDGKGDR